SCQHIIERFRRFHGDGSDHNLVHSHNDRVKYIVSSSQAATELHGDPNCLDDSLKYLAIARVRFTERAVQIDDVNHFRAVVLETQSDLDRIGIVDFGGIFAALRQAHTTTVAQIDRGNDHH